MLKNLGRSMVEPMVTLGKAVNALEISNRRREHTSVQRRHSRMTAATFPAPASGSALGLRCRRRAVEVTLFCQAPRRAVEAENAASA